MRTLGTPREVVGLDPRVEEVVATTAEANAYSLFVWRLRLL
jgi:hypothetical protein